MRKEYIYAYCYDCGCPLPGIHKNRLKANPRRRCSPCFAKTRSGRTMGQGYVYVRVAIGKPMYAEHRVIMEKILGRKLKRTEVVHHINHDRSDNRPENLRLYSSPGTHVLEEQHVIRGKDGKFKRAKLK